MKVMFDINVILDIVANREPFFEISRTAYLKTIEKNDEPYIAVHAIATLFYLLGSAATRKQRDAAMDWVCSSFKIASAGEREVNAARKLGFDDFEDALVATSAMSAGCERIVTRNVKDFANSPVKAVEPLSI